jgi:oligoribonuclease
MTEAEQKTLEFLSQWIPPGKSPLCGNSVHQDRRFIHEYLPKLDEFFHYRIIDVSTVKELAKRWYKDLPEFGKKKVHLALDDIKESVGELKYYREKVFK